MIPRLRLHRPRIVRIPCYLFGVGNRPLVSEATDPSILANAPGELSVEVQLDQATPDAVERLQKCIGFNGQEGNVLLTVVNGAEDISLELKPNDIAVLKDALDLCENWARSEQSSEETAG